jgi:hypothetical protein
VISDIACARCGTAESNNTAAAASVRLRTNLGTEILLQISFMRRPPGRTTAGAQTTVIARLPRLALLHLSRMSN